MFIDLWGWFNDYAHEAQESGDKLKQRLVAVAYEGWDYRRLADAENAIRAFDEGLKIAKMLHEPRWEVFYQYWIAVVRLFVQSDYQNTLDNVVRLVTEIRKPQYQTFPVKSAIVFLLAKVYFHLDFRAYESEIVGLLDYLEKEIGMDEDTYLQMLAMTAEIEINHGRYPAAEEKLASMLNQSAKMPYRLYEAYRLLRRVAFIQGDLTLALENSRNALKYAQNIQLQNCIADEKLWGAVLLKYLGDDAQAREQYYAALAHYEQYKLILGIEYCTAHSEYLELNQQYAEALAAQAARLPMVNGQVSISQQIDAYCAYCALLGRLGKDFAEALAEGKRIAQSSKNPENYLARLNWIEAGNYFDYEWQKTSRKNRQGG